MLELLLCSMLTIFPDYLYRRYAQGKRIGKEITLFSVWFELRWGIIACLMLTIGLITVIFYNHPSTTNATVFFRTVPILPETNGRVAEVYVGVTGEVKQGAPIFRLDSSKQEAAAEPARRKIAETDAAMVVARTDVACRRGQDPGGQERPSAGRGRTGDQAGDLPAQPGHRRRRGISKSSRLPCEGRQGTIDARHRRQAVRRGADLHAPAGREGERRGRAGSGPGGSGKDRRSCRRERTGGAVHVAGGRHRQSVHAPGRSPDSGGRRAGRLQAGFGQIEAQIMKVGMVAEATCVSKPWTVIPMVVTGVQDFIAAGQFRGGEQLIDAQQVVRPGTMLVFLEPLYEGGLDGVTPGSSCIANAYTSNHDLIASGKVGTVKRLRSPCGGCGRARACHDPADPGAGVPHPDPRARRALRSMSGK